MIYHIDKHGEKHIPLQFKKAVEISEKDGADAAIEYLNGCAVRHEISKETAFFWGVHIMSSRLEVE